MPRARCSGASRRGSPSVLRGKHEPAFSPHLDAGDFVVVVNAAKVRLTGDKLAEKQYIRHTGYPGGMRRATAAEVLGEHPDARHSRRGRRACCRRTGSAAGSRPSSRSMRGAGASARGAEAATAPESRLEEAMADTEKFMWQPESASRPSPGCGCRTGKGEITVNERTLEDYFGARDVPHDRQPAVRGHLDGGPVSAST